MFDEESPTRLEESRQARPKKYDNAVVGWISLPQCDSFPGFRLNDVLCVSNCCALQPALCGVRPELWVLHLIMGPVVKQPKKTTGRGEEHCQ